MFSPGQHPLFPYTSEERAGILKDHGINEAEMKNDVDAVEEWFQKQTHLCEAGINRRVIELFIITNKGSVEEVKRKLDNFYRHRSNTPMYFFDRIKVINNGDIQKTADLQIVAAMPKLFKNARVSFTKWLTIDKFNIDDVIMLIFMLADIRLVNDWMAGDIWVLDLEGLTLSDLLKINPNSYTKALRIVHEGLGLKIFSIHILNCGIASLAQAIINLLKQFLSAKIIGRIVFHETVEDLQKYVPKEYIPKDYGGEMPSMNQFRDKMKAFLAEEKTKQFLIEACKMVSDESRRPKVDYSEDYLSGNFKKLDFD